MKADIAATMRLIEAGVNVLPAKMPINNGLRMNTQDP